MIPIGDSEKVTRPPWVTMTLIILNAGLFVFLYFMSRNPGAIIDTYAFVPARFLNTSWNPLVNSWKYVPLFSAHFLHGGWLHIIGNMLFLYTFGDNLEDRIGHFRYLCFYIVCGIISLLVFTYVYPHSSAYLLGASGAIAGVMGGFYILFPRCRVRSFFLFFITDIPAIYYLLIWFLFNLIRGMFPGKFMEPVAWWAHISGFVAGALLVNLFISGGPVVKAKVKVKTGN